VVKGLLIDPASVTINQRPNGFYLDYIGWLPRPKVNDQTVKKSTILNDLDIIEIGQRSCNFLPNLIKIPRINNQQGPEDAGSFQQSAIPPSRLKVLRVFLPQGCIFLSCCLHKYTDKRSEYRMPLGCHIGCHLFLIPPLFSPLPDNVHHFVIDTARQRTGDSYQEPTLHPRYVHNLSLSQSFKGQIH